VVQAGAAAAVPSVRRVRASDPSWPTAASWEKLKQVGGAVSAISRPKTKVADAWPLEKKLRDRSNIVMIQLLFLASPEFECHSL